MRVNRKPGISDKFKAATKALNGVQGKVGWMPSAVYEGGQPVAGVAMVQEFGSPKMGIPPRLGMRAMATERKEEWKAISKDIAKKVMQGEADNKEMLETVAQVAAGNLREQITNVTSPPLKSATVAARKRQTYNGGKGAKSSISKPLVHTGVLLNTVSHEVKTK